MSSRIYWEPNETEHGRTDLGKADDSLKLILRDEYGYPLDQIFDKSDLGMFRGLLMAGYKDAGKVIKHIDKYDSIRIWEAQ